MSRKRSYNSNQVYLDIPAKANRVLHIILIALFVIGIRVWHLSVIQYEEKLEESKKPQRRTVIDPAKRGTIRDRFNQPLAVNKIQYQAALLYSQIKQIPAAKWQTDSEGKKVKVNARKEYITKLSQFLAKELDLDPERVEDLIYSKASFYFQLPFVIKEEISEKEYYRLKTLEKDWPGVHVQILPKRDYPQGRVGADIIGYMGAITKNEFESVLEEIKILEQYIAKAEQGDDPALPRGVESYSYAKQKLQDLREKSYTIHDFVGKTGVEGRFEKQLRGFHGRKSYFSDARGNFLKELPGSREPLSGQRLLLTISAELQEYAEKLLAQNERIRFTKSCGIDAIKENLISLKQPWIKGGAIVAMDPNSGEILALASYPRIDPNDFIVSGNPEISKEKRSRIQRWFETETYLGEIWDQKRPLERERYDDKKGGFYDEELYLNWDQYLNFILAEDSLVKEKISRLNIEGAIDIQYLAERILELTGQTNLYAIINEWYPSDPHIQHGAKLTPNEREGIQKSLKTPEAMMIKRRMDRYVYSIPSNYDKVLYIDLCRVAIDPQNFTQTLYQNLGKHNLFLYKEYGSAFCLIREAVMAMSKELFHIYAFKPWRKLNEKEFLKAKRQEEKIAHKYPKPYIDYFDQKEKELFEEFWNAHQWQLIETLMLGDWEPVESSHEMEPYFEHFIRWHTELMSGAHASLSWNKAFFTLNKLLTNLPAKDAYQSLRTFRGFNDLNRPLYGRYRGLRSENNVKLEKHLAMAFYPMYGYGYGRSYAYRQAATQGSIFKLVTAYEALVQRYNKLVESGVKPIQLNPLNIVDQVVKAGKNYIVGYTEDGKPIPQFYKGGRLPKSLSKSLGHMDIIKAIETSSNPYFSLLAGDVLQSPADLARAASDFSYGALTGIDLPAEITGKIPKDLEYNRTGLYSMAIGQHSLVVTPIQTALMLSAIANGGNVLKPKIVNVTAGKFPIRSDAGLLKNVPFALYANEEPQKNLISYLPSEVKNQLFMPKLVRNILLEGMRRVVTRSHGPSLYQLSKFYKEHPEAISDYVEMKDQLVGKTSTAESVEKIDLDLHKGTNMYNHLWFGGIVFDSNNKKTHLFKDPFGNPEVVVVVYLRFGAYGKETAPLAAQMAVKWREIKQKHANSLLNKREP